MASLTPSISNVATSFIDNGGVNDIMSGLNSFSDAKQITAQGALTADQLIAQGKVANIQYTGASAAALLGAQGDTDEANAYGQASTFATQNAAIVGESTRLSGYQAQRQLMLNTGSASAAAAGNGLTGGGSAADIIRSSRQQGALQQQVIKTQGMVNQNAYESEAASYTGMQGAAQAAAAAGKVTSDTDLSMATEIQNSDNAAAAATTAAAKSAAKAKKQSGLFSEILGIGKTILPFI